MPSYSIHIRVQSGAVALQRTWHANGERHYQSQRHAVLVRRPDSRGFRRVDPLIELWETPPQQAGVRIAPPDIHTRIGIDLTGSI